jgi:CBS domain containing-hemolysin-like protein
MLTLFIVVLAVLVGSAICALAETVLLSVPQIKVKQWAQTKKPAAIALAHIKKKMNRPIATIVVLNNIFNIVGSIIIGNLTARELGDAWLGVFSAILTFFIILFGEILPKTLGQQYAENLALFLAFPVKFVTIVFTPLIWLLEKGTTPFTKGKVLPTTNESEIRLLARIGRNEGVIEADEAEMIQRVFQLNDLTASDLMSPRITLTYLQGNLNLEECQQDIINSEHSRILIINKTIDEVIGIGLKHELLTSLIEGRKTEKLASLARSVHFVPETIRADSLLKNFQDTRQHLMVVLDEYGGVAGVVTLEDVLEVLTGEIVDETDTIIDLQEIARQKRSRLLMAKGINNTFPSHLAP